MGTSQAFFFSWVKIREHLGEKKDDERRNEPHGSQNLTASFISMGSQMSAGILIYSLLLNNTGTFSYLTSWKWLGILNPSFIGLHQFLPVMPKLSPMSPVLWSFAVTKYKGIMYSSILIILSCVYIMFFIAKTPKAIAAGWIKTIPLSTSNLNQVLKKQATRP